MSGVPVLGFGTPHIYKRQIYMQKTAPKGGLSKSLVNRLRLVLSVEFDDEVRFHVNSERHIGQARTTYECRGHFVVVCFDVIRHVTLSQLGGFEDNCELFGAITHFDHVTLFHAVGGDVHALAVHGHVTVVHELTGCKHGCDEFRTVDNGVKAGFEQTDEVFASVATTLIIAELILDDFTVTPAGGLRMAGHGGLAA